MPRIHQTFRLPDICHKKKLLVGQFKNVSALTAKGLLAPLAPARIGVLRPRSPNGRGGKQACGIGSPTGTTGGYHPVSAVFLENRGRLVVSSGEDTDVATRMVQEIVRQFGNMQGEVFFETISMLRMKYLGGWFLKVVLNSMKNNAKIELFRGNMKRI